MFGENYPANKTNMKKRGDYGVRVAKYGYDASACSDSQLLFNSNWPIIQIAMMKKIDGEPHYIGRTEFPTISEETPYELLNEYDRSIAGVDRKYVYTKAHIRQYAYTKIVSQFPVMYEFYQVELYGFKHNLGYTPMFFGEGDFNGYDPNHNRVVLTNIDITKDVDYPYVDTPRMFTTHTSDYGIKSKAYYTNRLKSNSKIGVGLDTSIQGKQIQAVKTQETLAEDGWGQFDVPSVTYYPPKDSDGKTIMSADKFEYYGFASNIEACIRSPEDFNAGGGMGGQEEYTNTYMPLNMGYGDIYFRRIVLPLPLGGFSGSSEIIGGFIVPYMGRYDLDHKYNWKKQSMVVVRMPMVSPDVLSVEVV